MLVVRKRPGKTEEGTHAFQSCLGSSTAKCSLGRSTGPTGTSNRLDDEDDGELCERDGIDNGEATGRVSTRTGRQGRRTYTGGRETC
jgi:hypothetical protein